MTATVRAETAEQTDGSRFVAARAAQWLAASATAAAPSATAASATAPIAAAASATATDLRGDTLDHATPAHIVTATVAALTRGETHYTPRPGILPLRRALAATIAAEGGPEYDPATEVLVASGAREGGFVATQMLVRPGDEVLLPDPCAPHYAEAVRLAGGVAVSVPLRAADRWGMTAAAIASCITPRTRVLLLTAPGSPTGGVTSRAEWEKIAALAEAHDLRVLVDESYKAFHFDGAVHTPVATLLGMRIRTITVGSFSRTYAMAGWRVGYVVGDAALLHAITDFKLALSICSAAPSQWAAVAALDGPQEEVETMHAEIAARRAALLPALATMGLPHGDPQGAYYALADIRGTGLSAAACAAVFAVAAGVLALPGDLFGPSGAGHVRFAMTQPAPVLAEAMARLAPVVAGLRARQTKGVSA